MKRGMTLIELVVVLAIMLTIGVMLLKAYELIFKKSFETTTVLKSEMDIQLTTVYLLKDLETVGFGVTKDYYSAGNECDFLSFLNNRRAIAICNGGQDLYFLSLAVREQKKSGCWGLVDSTGTLDLSSAKDRLGADCTGGTYIVLSRDRSTIKSTNCQPPDTNCSSDGIAFFTGGRSYPNDFAVRYCLGPSPTCAQNGNIPTECAPGTFNLYKELNGESARPVLSCVKAFRVFYGVAAGSASSLSYTLTPPSDINQLKAIRMCLIFQVGRRTDIRNPNPPNFSTNCGGMVTYTSDQEFYKWDVLEIDIPVRNLQ